MVVNSSTFNTEAQPIYLQKLFNKMALASIPAVSILSVQVHWAGTALGGAEEPHQNHQKQPSSKSPYLSASRSKTTNFVSVVNRRVLIIYI